MFGCMDYIYISVRITVTKNYVMFDNSNIYTIYSTH